MLKKYPFLKVLGNRYMLVTIFVAVWWLFLDNYSYIEHRSLNKKIKELDDNTQYFIEGIKHDTIAIKQLKNADQTERYAREKYFMKREDEDIYLIEFEEDAKKVEDTTSL